MQNLVRLEVALKDPDTSQIRTIRIVYRRVTFHEDRIGT